MKVSKKWLEKLPFHESIHYEQKIILKFYIKNVLNENLRVIKVSPALQGTALETAKIVNQKQPAKVIVCGACFNVGIEIVNRSRNVINKQKAYPHKIKDRFDVRFRIHHIRIN